MCVCMRARMCALFGGVRVWSVEREVWPVPVPVRCGLCLCLYLARRSSG